MRQMGLLAAAAGALVAGSALAADLPRRVAPPIVPVIAPFSWTGCSIGTMTGYIVTDRQRTRTVGNDAGTAGVTNTALNVAQLRRPPLIRGDNSGFTNLGGGVGCDYQFGVGSGLVIGAAADATWTDLTRRRLYLSPLQPANGFVSDPSVFRQSLDWLGTARGRVGYAFDRFLVYGTGGLAFGDVEYRASFFRNTDIALAYLGRRSSLDTGYTYGGGIEYAVPADSFLSRVNLLSLVGFRSDAITLKFEYLHYDLGRKNVVVGNTGIGPTSSYTSRFRTEGDLFRGGVTYRFGSIFGR